MAAQRHWTVAERVEAASQRGARTRAARQALREAADAYEAAAREFAQAAVVAPIGEESAYVRHGDDRSSLNDRGEVDDFLTAAREAVRRAQDARRWAESIEI